MSDIQNLADAFNRISEEVAASPDIDTLLIAVNKERSKPGADEKALKLFGKILFEAIKHRPEPPLPADIQALVDEVVEDLKRKGPEPA